MSQRKEEERKIIINQLLLLCTLSAALWMEGVDNDWLIDESGRRGYSWWVGLKYLKILVSAKSEIR